MFVGVLNCEQFDSGNVLQILRLVIPLVERNPMRGWSVMGRACMTGSRICVQQPGSFTR